MQNLAEKKVSHCDDGHDKSDGGIVIIAVVTILMQAAAAAVKGRKLGDKFPSFLKLFMPATSYLLLENGSINLIFMQTFPDHFLGCNGR